MGKQNCFPILSHVGILKTHFFDIIKFEISKGFHHHNENKNQGQDIQHKSRRNTSF